jgi:chorismate synthase
MAGALVRPILGKHGIEIGSHLVQVGTITSEASVTMEEIHDCTNAGMLACVPEGTRALMEEEIRRASDANDSVGAVIECVAQGLPAGIGEPLFEKLDAMLSHAIMSIPGTKGIAFGAGFDIASMRGSVANDPIVMQGGRATMETNNAGGVLGGISTGMPLVFRVAMKPTPSIGREQRTVNLSQGTETVIEMGGRHDPCIGVRAVPVVTNMTAFVLADLLMGATHGRY